MYKAIYDLKEGNWKLIKVHDNGKITVRKKSKLLKDIKTYIKKYLKNTAIEYYKKNNREYDNLTTTIKAQKKIDRALEWGITDEVLKVERLANLYNYRTEELYTILNKKRKRKKTSQSKKIKTSYFYTSASNSLMAFTNEGYKKILMVASTLQEYRRIEIVFYDDDGNSMAAIVDRKELEIMGDNVYYYGQIFRDDLKEIGTSSGEEGEVILRGVL